MSAKNLSNEAPRSPYARLGGYVILARAIDKCAADLAGTIGEYHTNCPLDRHLFDWKGTDYDAFRALVASGADDEAVVKFINETGTPKSAEEIAAWSEDQEGLMPYNNPDGRDWFISVCEPLGIDPKTSTLFEFLVEDDRQTFAK
ncbi:MAG: DUF5069 domain-containing protein [Chthoniobacterales bacterium]